MIGTLAIERRRWGVIARRTLPLILAVFAWLTLARPTLAHVGPPYPVLLDEPVGPYVVSSLADPDVGVGTFILAIVDAQGRPAPPDTQVVLSVRPLDGHAAPASHVAQWQRMRDGERFIAQVPFDAEGMWQVQLSVEGTAGRGEISFDVRVTPANLPWLSSLLCLAPFLLVGILWIVGARRQRRRPQRRTTDRLIEADPSTH